MVKTFLGDTLFGNSRSWKRSQGQVPKKKFFLIFLMANLESLVNFLQEYGFVIHMGLVDFELQAFLLWRLSPKYPDLTFFKVNISENILPNDLKLYGSSILVT